MTHDWHTETVSTLCEFQVEFLKRSGNSALRFRGQASAEWSLIPSFLRDRRSIAHNNDLLDHENQSIKDFISLVGPHLGNIERGYLGVYANGFPGNDRDKAKDAEIHRGRTQCLYVMQHFGAPTRLLDWTHSMAVAAYFACVDPDCLEDDACIWWYAHDKLYGFLHKHWENWGIPRLKDNGNEIDMDHSIYYEKCPHFVREDNMKLPFPRIQAQLGMFTVPSRFDVNHEAQILKQVGSEGCGRIVIKNYLKLDILNWLSQLGTHASSLQYPIADILSAKLKSRHEEKLRK